MSSFDARTTTGQPNGLAHLPPMMARQLSHQAKKLTKTPLRTHAEGGQVEPVVGSLSFTSSSNPTKRSQASAKDKNEEQEKHDTGYKPERGSP